MKRALYCLLVLSTVAVLASCESGKEKAAENPITPAPVPAASPSPASTPAPAVPEAKAEKPKPVMKEVKGTVVSINRDKGTLVITPKDGQADMAFTMKKDMGETVKAGNKVIVTYEKSDKGNVAKKIMKDFGLKVPVSCGGP